MQPRWNWSRRCARCSPGGRTSTRRWGRALATLGAGGAAQLPGLTHGDAHLAVGSEFAGHRIDAVVARGGQGVVFRATDHTLHRAVALKVIAPEVAGNPTFRARFQRECQLAASIDHPHVVEVFHAGEEEGLLYVTMRYVDGTDLRRLLETVGRLDPARAVSIVADVAGALDEAHRLGLVHRDVKPGNVLIAVRSGRERAFLTDFGITKRAADEPLTRTGIAVGTVDYIAPEQAHGGDVDARADVYSLGCLLFQSLTGKLVFDRDSDLEKIWAHVHDPPPRLRSVRPDLPQGLEDVIGRALAKDPAERPRSAGEFARAASGRSRCSQACARASCVCGRGLRARRQWLAIGSRATILGWPAIVNVRPQSARSGSVVDRDDRWIFAVVRAVGRPSLAS